ncbi:hypothethical protein (plasmid) [Ralstonia solanacearum PSI07]|nr:hypothethical protein [Ralstonia solanacearum PSI07]
MRQAALAGPGQRGGLLGHRRHLVHGAQQVTRGREDLARGRTDLGGGGGGLGGGGLLLLGRRRDLRHRRGHLQRRFLRLRNQARQLLGHAIEAFLQRAEFVGAVQVQPLRQIAGAHGVVHVHQPHHRHGHRPVQGVAQRQRRQQHDAQRHGQRDLGAQHRGADLPGRSIGHRAVVGDQLVDHVGHCIPGWPRAQRGRLPGRLGSACQGQRLADLRHVLVDGGAEGTKTRPVILAEDGGFVVGRILVERLEVFGHAVEIAAQGLGVAVDEQRAFQRGIAVARCRPQRGGDVQAGHGIALQADGLFIDHAQACVGDRRHHQHQHEQHAEAQDDPVAECEAAAAKHAGQGCIADAWRGRDHVDAYSDRRNERRASMRRPAKLEEEQGDAPKNATKAALNSTGRRPAAETNSVEFRGGVGHSLPRHGQGVSDTRRGRTAWIAGLEIAWCAAAEVRAGSMTDVAHERAPAASTTAPGSRRGGEPGAAATANVLRVVVTPRARLRRTSAPHRPTHR